MGCADFGSRTVPKTRAPRSASNCAISRPMPEETPVTNVVLFFNVMCIYTSCFEFVALRAFRFFLFVQGQCGRFEIGENGGPTLFTQSFDCGILGGLPGRRKFLNLISPFGRNRQFHPIAAPAANDLHQTITLQWPKIPQQGRAL